MSRYSNYTMKNNVFSTLYAPISALATTIQVESWQWTRWWTSFPMLATLEHIDSWKVLKREIVEITAISWDVLTVVRGFAPCPASDDANAQWTTRFSFDAWDSLSMYIPKEIFDNISDAINDLYNNWSDRIFAKSTGWLWIEITGWNVRVWSQEFEYAWWTATLNDDATNYVMLDWASTIQIDTVGRNQQYVKVAEITTSWWEIVSIHQWRMDAIWWQLGGAAGFRNISNCVYSRWQLVQFVADWEQYNLTYERWRLKTIVSWAKTFVAQDR